VRLRRRQAPGTWLRVEPPGERPVHRCPVPLDAEVGTGSEWACGECRTIWERLADGSWRRTARRLTEAL
jgi:hypothetical protein